MNRFLHVNNVLLLILLTCTICLANGKVAVKGVVYSEKSKPIPKVKVIAYTFSKKGDVTKLTPIISSTTNKEGEFQFSIDNQSNYYIQCIKEGWKMHKETIIYAKNAKETQKISITCKMSKGNSSYFLDGKLTSENNDHSNLTFEVFDIAANTIFIQNNINKDFSFYFNHKGEYILKVMNTNKNILYMKNVIIKEPKQYIDIHIPSSQKKQLEVYPFLVNTSKIVEEAHPELDAIAKKMQEKDKFDIRIECHTDSRGDDDFNLKISKEQASSIKNYLILQGISPERILIEGFGENFLLNECKNNVKCSNLKHLENRRVEYLFLISAVR